MVNQPHARDDIDAEVADLDEAPARTTSGQTPESAETGRPATDSAPHPAKAFAEDAPSGRGADDDDDELPPMTEQMAQQLGGIRGLIESGIPVGVFVIANVFLSDLLRLAFDIRLSETLALRWAIGSAVGVAVLIAILRAARKEPIRHAINGLFGIAIGAFLAWKSGDQGDFYLPGIIQGAAYGLALMGSVAVRHPLVGWIWSVVAGGGKSDWRQDRGLVRTFGWLTMLWGVVFLVKNLFRGWLYLADLNTVLGVVTLVGGYPLTALLVLVSLVVVRRSHPGSVLAGAKPGA